MDEESDQARATDEFEPFKVITAKAKIRGFAFAPTAAVRAVSRQLQASPRGPSRCLARMALSLANNVIEVLDISVPLAGSQGSEEPGTGAVAAADVTPDVVRRLDQGGHRADVRALSLSLDDRLLITASHAAVKVKHVQSFSICLYLWFIVIDTFFLPLVDLICISPPLPPPQYSLVSTLFTGVESHDRLLHLHN
jgi:hypothetical protein